MTARLGRLAAAILFALMLAGGMAGAQSIDTDEGSTEEASLFGSSDEGEGSVLDTSGLFDDDALVTDAATSGDPEPVGPAVEIGGSYRFSLTGEAAWSSFQDLADAPLEPESQGVTVDLGATVFLDARPADDFRVFGKVDLSYPFTTDVDAQPPRDFDDIVSVRELFSDFTLGDVLFLRGGKHTIAWGVGYFFSPADVLNLTAIDPDNPEAEREGPVSLRANLPIDFHNLYLYVVADPGDDGVELAAAPKAEFVVGGTEIGIGGFLHTDRVPRAMLTLTTSLLDFDLFGELEASLGSERRFVERADRGPDTPHGLRAVRNSDDLFAAATGGLRYTYRPEEGDWSATLAGQYLWNGEGYGDAAILRDNRRGVMKLIESGDLSFGDLIFPGRHYAGASASVALGRGADWSMGAFWLSNLSDGSGRVSPSVTFRPADQLTLRASASITYGEDGAEMTPFGTRVGASITATLGSGRF